MKVNTNNSPFATKICQDAYQLGVFAAEDWIHHKEYSVNPYDEGTVYHKQWIDGFKSAIAEMSGAYV